MWEGRISIGSATPLPQGGGAQAQPSFGVFLYLCLHPLTQNDQIRMVTHWEGRVLGCQSVTPLQLHKSVARFVSDSWFSCFLPQP